MMFIARRRALGSPFILRRVVGKGPAANVTDVIVENTRKIKAYQTLVHTRKLWEQSSNEDNKKAFKQIQPLRDVRDKKLEGDNWPLHDFEAPERHLTAKKITEKFAKVMHQERDAPVDVNPNQLWYSPEELMPVEEGQQPHATIDDDEIDNTFLDDEEVLEESTTTKLELKMEEARKKKHYYDRLDEEASYGELKEGDELERVFREDAAKLDVMDFPDVDYRPPPDSVIFREQELMTNLYNEQKANEGVQTSEEQDRPLVSEEDAEMMAENTGMEGKRDQDEDSGLGTEGEDEQADPRIKKCVMCGANAPKLHTMNVYLLSRFVSTHGDIFPRQLTGTCLRHQRDISNIYRAAKGRGLISFKGGFQIHIPYEEPPKDSVRPDAIQLNQTAQSIGEGAEREGEGGGEGEQLREVERLLSRDEEVEEERYVPIPDEMDLDEADLGIVQDRRKASEKVLADRVREPKRDTLATGPRNAKEFAQSRRGAEEESDEEDGGRRPGGGRGGQGGRGGRGGGQYRGGGQQRGGGRGGQFQDRQGGGRPGGYSQYQQSSRGPPPR